MLKFPKANTLADGLTERTSFMLDKIQSKTIESFNFVSYRARMSRQFDSHSTEFEQIPQICANE